MTVAKLARAGGVGVETIRYYQRRGLLKTPRRHGIAGHGARIRRYGEDDLRRLRFIRSAQSAGFRLAEIAELLKLDARDDRPRARKLATQRIEALDLQIEKLTVARNALARLARKCQSSASGPCPIIAAFDGV